MKRILIPSLLCALAAATSAHSAGEVRLLDARSRACNGASNCMPYLEAMIEVKNIAYAKQVGIHYRDTDGSWKNFPAQYFSPTSSGRERWQLFMPSPPASYAVYYTVNGVTYWDNNGGRNYVHSQTQDDAQLGPDVYMADAEGAWSAGTASGLLQGNILVRNVAPSKTLRARYTDNGWATTREGWATYRQTFPSGVELWGWQLPTAASVTPSQVKLAWQLQWGSVAVWDNNFGRNYGLNSHFLVAR